MEDAPQRPGLSVEPHAELVLAAQCHALCTTAIAPALQRLDHAVDVAQKRG